jgi:hypothetical protein
MQLFLEERIEFFGAVFWFTFMENVSQENKLRI